MEGATYPKRCGYMRVAVVGAGVAGSIFAYLASTDGHDVDVFDLARRYVKPCGEVVPTTLINTLREANVPLPNVVEDIRVFEFIDGDTAQRYEIAYRKPIWLSIEKTSWVNTLRDNLRLQVGGVQAAQLIDRGYDLVVDARGPFASAGRRIPVWRAYVPGRLEERAIVVMRRRPFGIAWAFGHGDRINIGGGFYGISNPRDATLRLLSGLIGTEGVHEQAYSLVTLAPRISLHPGPRVVRIGEAAGLIQSLGGEGIRPAAESAIALYKALRLGGRDVDSIVGLYVNAVRGLVIESRFSTLLLSLAMALGPSALRLTSREFFDLWLGGKLRYVRRVLTSLLPSGSPGHDIY